MYSRVASHTKSLKNGIHSFPAWGSAHRDGVENKPATLLVVSLGKALKGIPPSSCGRQEAGPSSRGGPSLTKDMQTEHELIRKNKKSNLKGRGKLTFSIRPL